MSHIFDLDDTLTLKPQGFDNTGMSKDEFFDASRAFSSDERVAYLARFLASRGDAIAVCTARPSERLCESYQWLMKWRIPFDALMLSTGRLPSGMAKQHMLKYLRRQYKRIGTMVDDSPYNVVVLGSKDWCHPRTEERRLLNANFELVTKV